MNDKMEIDKSEYVTDDRCGQKLDVRCGNDTQRVRV